MGYMQHSYAYFACVKDKNGVYHMRKNCFLDWDGVNTENEALAMGKTWATRDGADVVCDAVCHHTSTAH